MNGFFQLPPLHPILIHFPLALIPVAFAADSLGRWTKIVSLSHAAWWAILFATLAAPFTAASGWLWLRQMEDMEHSVMGYHQWLGTALPLALIPIAWWRFRLHRAAKIASNSYLVVLGLALLAAMIQGHLGGMMSFGDTALPAMQMPPSTLPSLPAHENHPVHVTAPATNSSDNDGWGTSIKVKEPHHE